MRYTMCCSPCPRGRHGITYRGEEIHEQQTVGPGGLTVGPDGTFWLLDTSAQRLLHYSPTRQRLGVIMLDDAPRSLLDVAVTTADIYVLDTSPTTSA